MSIKATHQEALGFYMFHCYNIYKHISISALFFIISISCFEFFLLDFYNNCPQGWGFSAIFLPHGSWFRTFFVPGGGEFTLSKKFPGGMVRLGID